MVDIDETLNLTHSEGHKVKGQDEIYNHDKILLFYIKYVR